MKKKDLQIDLCGSLSRREEQAFLPLAPDDPFRFACAGCGDCCKNREDIVLSGGDLYRICGWLRLPPAVVIRGYCRHYIGAETGLPVVRLQPLAAEQNRCPFLYRHKCSIHEAKPLVCALYPLAQQIDTDTGAVTYYAQPTDCGGPVHHAACADYLERYGIPQRQPTDVQWAVGCTALSRRVRQLVPQLHPVQGKMLGFQLYKMLYLSIDWQQPYPPQQAQAFREANAYLDLLAERARKSETQQREPERPQQG